MARRGPVEQPEEAPPTTPFEKLVLLVRVDDHPPEERAAFAARFGLTLDQVEEIRREVVARFPQLVRKSRGSRQR